MKLHFLILAMLVSATTSAFGSLERGRLESGKGYCEVEYQTQNADVKMFTVNFNTREYELSFFNEILPTGRLKSIEGLFQKSGDSYQEVIGSPIFAVGRYFRFNLDRISKKRIRIKKTSQFAVLAPINYGIQVDVCHLD